MDERIQAGLEFEKTLTCFRAVAAAAFLLPLPLAGQTLVGRVLDEYTEVGVPGVRVVLVDESGRGVLDVESDSAGYYRLQVPGPGAFSIGTTRLGYEEGRTPLLDLSFEGSRTLDLVLTPAPVALDRLDVTVSAEEALERELQSYGIVPGMLPRTRIVTQEEIEAVVGAKDFAAVLGRQNIAGIQVARMDPLPRVCVKMGEGWSSGCAILVVDGIVTPPNTRIQQAMLIPPEGLAAIVVLKPYEATLQFGGAGGNGAVLIFTKGRMLLRQWR